MPEITLTFCNETYPPWGDADETPDPVYDSWPVTFDGLRAAAEGAAYFLGSCEADHAPVRNLEHVRWLSSTDDDVDYRTGETTRRSVHLDAIEDPRARAAIVRHCDPYGLEVKA